jgi:hypothetical protein
MIAWRTLTRKLRLIRVITDRVTARRRSRSRSESESSESWHHTIASVTAAVTVTVTVDSESALIELVLPELPVVSSVIKLSDLSIGPLPASHGRVKSRQVHGSGRAPTWAAVND